MSVIEIEKSIEVVEKKDDPVTEVLRNAKTYIEEHGWSSYGSHGPNGEICIVSAIVQIVTDFNSLSLATDRFMKVNKICGIGRWNDTPGRTLQEVYEAFDRAIAAS